MTIFWLILAACMAVLEAVTTQLVSIWFVVGALSSCITSLITDNIIIQVIVFVVVSALAVILTRPLVKRITFFKKSKTNSDRFIGQTGVVISPINNETATGQVRVGSSIWSAKTEDGSQLEKDTPVYICDIQGVKLVVKRKDKVNITE